MTDREWLNQLCANNNYLEGQLLPGGRYACITPMLYTTAIIVGQVGDDTGYDDRWCYENVFDAVLALRAWGGEGEPVGWHRHPASGRRVIRNESVTFQ